MHGADERNGAPTACERPVAPTTARRIRDILGAGAAAGGAVGCLAAGGTGSHAQPPDRCRVAWSHRPAERADPRHGTYGPESGSLREDPGSGRAPVGPDRGGQASGPLTAADTGRGNGSRPGRNGAGLRRGIRVDMPSGRTAAHHGAALAGGGRGPQENALADRGHRGPSRGGGRNSLAARASLRDGGRTSPRASRCHSAGQAPPRGENHLHRQPVQRVRRMRRSRRRHRPSRRRTLE